MTFEEIVERCLELRRAFERDEARFFLGLHEVERDHMECLRERDYTFDKFLRSNELCRVERYRSFKDGLAHTTAEKAEQMGAPAVMALAAVRDKTKIPDYEEAVAAWSETHGGLTPRAQTAERLLRQVDSRPEVPKAVRQIAKRNAELEELRAENKHLRAENRMLKRKLAKYEKSDA